jgi:hypothetical protein
MDGTLRKQLYDIFREFFRRSNIWLFEMPIYVIAQSNDYVLNTCQHAHVIRLMALDRPSYPLPNPAVYIPGDPPQFLEFAVSPSFETQNPFPRVPRGGALLSTGKCPILRIQWNPGAHETWIATLALNIADPMDANGLPTDMPEWIIDKYYDHLYHGVTGKLMLQPNKPFSSPKLAEYHMRKFNEGVGLARTEVRHMFTYAGQRWAFPQTYATPLHHKAV